jgi:hypothetical protein
MADSSGQCGGPGCDKIGNKDCGACKNRKYCSPDCQKADWKSHKKSCKKAVHKTPSPSAIPKMDFGEVRKLYCHWDNLIPKFDEEYKAKYPLDSSGTGMIKSEREGTIMMMATNIESLMMDENKESFQYRWLENTPELREFIMGAKVGDVYDSPHVNPYVPGSVQHYRNTPPFEPPVLESGKVILDFGFVDFGIALDGVSSIKTGDAPTIVYAFDKEPFAIAKSLVIMQMMQDKSVSPRSLVEVWMSTLWTHKTLQLFRASLATVISNSDDSQNTKVMAIFLFWQQSTNVKAETAKQFWIKNRRSLDSSVMNACNLSTVSDRVEYMRYQLTGALYEDCDSTYGSIVMCTENKTLGIVQKFDCCLQAVPASSFFLRPSLPQIAIMDSAKSFFEKQINEVAQHIRDGTLVFIPQVAEISLVNKDLLQKLKLLNPYIVSWSNLCDYIPIKDFHAMAKMISCPDTFHHMHSCNWCARVYGSDIYDMAYECRRYFYDNGAKMMGDSQSASMGFSNFAVSHSRNICSVSLIRGVSGSYMKHFFKGHEVAKWGPQSGKGLFSFPSFTTRDMRVMYIMYSYNKGMQMNGQPEW